MTETKKTLAILKARWPEVFLIVGFSTLGHGTSRLIMSSDSDSTLKDILGCSSVFFLFSLMIISMILEYGFLRTVHLEGPKKHTPEDLLKTGKHFFWRMVGASLIIGILFFILVGIFFLLLFLLNFTSIKTGFFESAKSNPQLHNLSIVFARSILIKLSLFIAAIIIVLDCRVFESFNFLKKFKLSESKELVVLYFLSMALLFVWVLLKIPYNPETILQYSLRIGVNVIHHVLSLIIAVMAVRFVGSLNLVYDKSMKDSNSEDSIETLKED
jgi:hypothetical protein